MTHDWSKTVRLFGRVLTCCAVCGIVRRKDKTENPCKGPTRMRPSQEGGRVRQAALKSSPHLFS